MGRYEDIMKGAQAEVAKPRMFKQATLKPARPAPTPGIRTAVLKSGRPGVGPSNSLTRYNMTESRPEQVEPGLTRRTVTQSPVRGTKNVGNSPAAFAERRSEEQILEPGLRGYKASSKSVSGKTPTFTGGSRGSR